MGRHFSTKVAALIDHAAGNCLRFRARSIVVFLSLLVVIIPLLSALSLGEGIKQEALNVLSMGPDLLVAADDFGRPGSVPVQWSTKLSGLPGVIRVVPRATGRVLIDELPAVLVGVGQPVFNSITDDVAHGFNQGSAGDSEILFKSPDIDRGEVMVGSAIAAASGISTGDTLTIDVAVEGPERYRSIVFSVTDVIDPESNGIWSASLMAAHIEDVQMLFGKYDMFSDLLVYCLPGFETRISQEVAEKLGPSAKVQDRNMMAAYLNRGFDFRGGTFLVYYLGAAVLAIPILALASGFGLIERRREVAILKSFGWDTWEVLLLHFMEAAMIALAGASLAILLSLAWIRFGNGWPLNRFFVPGCEGLANFDLPYRFLWSPVMAVYIYSLTVTAAGCIAAAWKASSADPGDILFNER